MSYTSMNGVTILANNRLTIDGVDYKLPKSIFGGQCITQSNDRIFINGYEFVDGKFKLTLLALWHMIF